MKRGSKVMHGDLPSLAFTRNECSAAITTKLNRQRILKTALGAFIILRRGRGPPPGAPRDHFALNKRVARESRLLRFLGSQHKLRRLSSVILSQRVVIPPR